MSAPHSRWMIAAAALLAAQTMFVHWAEARERPPAVPDFSTLPPRMGDWIQTIDSPVEPEVARELRADRLVNRMYGNASTGAAGNVFLAWFQSQRGGAQPHSPKVCLPGSGWITEASAQVTLATAAGAIPVNRMIVAHQLERAVVVYWYQNSRRVMASEWAAKMWVVADSLRDRRSDIGLVRVIVWKNGSDQATEAQAESFASIIYPELAGLAPGGLIEH